MNRPSHSRPHPGSADRPVPRHLVTLALLIAALGIPHPAHAGAIAWRGLLDVAAAEWSNAYDLNRLTRGDAPYDAYRLRLFADAQVSEHLQLISQFVYADASGPYVDGIYASYTPWTDRDAHLLAGKVPWPVGTFAPRTYSNVNPLLTAPLIYQYHSSLTWYALPPTTDILLAAAGSGQSGVDYFGYPMGRGMPIVDDSYWDVGVIANGSQRPLEYALGVVAGAPGWGSTARDDNPGKSVLGRVGLLPVPWLRIGASGAYGPYLSYDVGSTLPPGRSVDDYNQVLAMADLGVQAGHLELNAEGARNTWQTPTVGDLRVDAGYVELKYQFLAGAYAAGRWDVERFGRIQDSAGDRLPWDADVTRVEAGLGYRFSRGTLGKLVYQHNTLDNGRAGDPRLKRSIVAAQLSIGF